MSLPKIAFNNVDLPTPELPERRVTLPSKIEAIGDGLLAIGEEARDKADIAYVG
jgi:hypothetical protein